MVNTITMQELRDYEPKVCEPDIVHVSQLFESILADYRKGVMGKEGLLTQGWTLFNESFGGFRPGVSVLTGETGSGKTTLGLNFLMQMLLRKTSCLWINLEMTWKDMRRKLAHYLVEKPATEFTDPDIAVLKELLDVLPLVVLRHHGPLSSDVALKCISFSAERFGTQFVFIDHLDYIQKSGKHWQGEAEIIGEFMRTLAGVASTHEQSVLLVAHPRKLEIRGIARREIHMDELKGSSSIKQEADAVFSLFQPDPQSTEIVLRAQKIRADWFSRNTGGKVRMMFEPNTLRYREIGTRLEWDQ